MKLNLRSAISGAAVLAIAGGILAAGAGSAFAATTPAWEPDPNSVGSLIFYNSAGQVVTSGTNLNHLFDFAEASTTDPTGTSVKATLFFASPAPGVPTGSWFDSQESLSTAYPNASAPAPLNTATKPVVTLGATDANMTAYIPTAVNSTTAGYTNMYQIRLVTTGGTAGGTNATAQYWETDILVNPTAGTWQQVFPAVVTATSTTLTASVNPATVGQATTLTATETPAAAGSVQFENGTTPIGSPVSVNASGVATTSYTPTAAGTQSLSAVFTPTDPTSFGGSTGTLSLPVNPASTPTTTSLTVSQAGTSGTDVSLSSTVAPAAAAGTVSWFDNGSTTALNATPVTPNASGVATLDIPAGLAAGAHSIVAKFTPTNVANFEASQSAPQAFTLQPPVVGACAQAGSHCTSTDTISATVPVGTLVLSTPYTTTPLNLGTMALNSGLTEYSTSATYGNISVVDTRSGDLPWTLTGLASNLSDGGTKAGSLICGQNVGLTGFTATGSGGFAGTATATNNPVPAAPVAPSGGACAGTSGLGGTTPHTVAAATAGLGTVTLSGGTITLIAPTATEPGAFTGTITYTVG
jgi:hypothetical protein